MSYSELRKDAETMTNRNSDRRKDVVAAKEQRVAFSIEGDRDVKTADESKIQIGHRATDA